MPHGSLRRLAPFAALVVLVIAGMIYLGVATRDSNGLLTASGTISAVEVGVASEISGRVVEVLVEEGDAVSAGQPLFRLDGALLEAQRQRLLAAGDLAQASRQTAGAALQTAQAQYELALIAARQLARPARSVDWQEETPWQYSLPSWYFEQAEEVAAAQAEVESAAQAVARARDRLDSVLSAAQRSDLSTAEERLASALAAYQVARDVQARAALARNTEDLLSAADDLLDEARQELEDAQTAYDDLFEDEADDELLQARADLALAQARFDAAGDRLRQLETGDFSPQVRLAQAQLGQAQAVLDQSLASVAQADAELASLEVQLDKLVVYAPIDGVIVTRGLEPGEVAVAGGPVMTIGDLANLTITVYLPEDRYGEVRLGDGAQVTADSFPGEVFAAVVARVASQAEFTPRNVQTEEGRRTTVFAVVLSLTDPAGRLKPGMPADVVFDGDD